MEARAAVGYALFHPKDAKRPVDVAVEVKLAVFTTTGNGRFVRISPKHARTA